MSEVTTSESDPVPNEICSTSAVPERTGPETVAVIVPVPASSSTSVFWSVLVMIVSTPLTVTIASVPVDATPSWSPRSPMRSPPVTSMVASLPSRVVMNSIWSTGFRRALTFPTKSGSAAIAAFTASTSAPRVS